MYSGTVEIENLYICKDGINIFLNANQAVRFHIDIDIERNLQQIHFNIQQLQETGEKI